MAANWFSAPAPVARRVRAYFAPVNRAAQTPVLFDPSEQGGFNLDAPPAPWISLGWIQEFARKPASKTSPLLTGIPAATLEQVRETLEAQVSFQFLSWTKLTMALATGSQHMNLLAPASGAAPAADGAQAAAGGDSAERLDGDIDCAASTRRGEVHGRLDRRGGCGLHRADRLCGRAGCGRVCAAGTDGCGLHPARDIQCCAGVAGKSTGLTLAEPLPGGAPAAGAKVQAVTGFVDREGGSFYQEWSALFVMEGSQGERIFFHYPRLQTMTGAEEAVTPLDGKNKMGSRGCCSKGSFWRCR